MARLISVLGALVAAFLVFLPLPFTDLIFMAPIQLLIAGGVLLASGQSANPLRLGFGVLAYAFAGVVLVSLVGNLIPLLGKLAAAPLAFVWCVGLGELALSKTKK